MFETQTLFVLLAVSFAAVLRGIAGFGFAIAAVPVLSLVIPPVEAVTLAVLLQLVIGVQDLWQLRGHAHRPSLLRLSLGALAGTPLGIWALTALSPDAARVLIAALVLAGLFLLLRYKPRHPHPHGGLALLAGLAAGAFSGLAAMPGPPAVVYYLGAGTSPAQTRASLLLFFFVTAVIAAPGLWLAGAIDGTALRLTLMALAPMLIGTWAGGLIFRRLNDAQYRRIALFVMAISAGLAGLRGMEGFF
ncbi:sulfite exporter TauE/SafE family protein [Rhodobacter maris]|uniref:Probable membrane transporter protein n=1 Tax=Rhodobacter maris TaxID=446682 RepID=A0A285RJB4_9RHOB|nr:sulfite exporter TauE/SafE family protein [Rhodobacter maris]SOB94183.1 hypothetical protein SAMN05877831_101347 [Rhodobacter maris]